MSTIPITKRGAELLKEELHRLKHVERPSVINAISEARAQGDLSENAEYDAAKEKQAFIKAAFKSWKVSCLLHKSLIRLHWMWKVALCLVRLLSWKIWKMARKPFIKSWAMMRLI